MALISALITELRTDLSDDSSTRFTDAQLLNLFKKAIRRANRIVQRNAIQFAKKKSALTTTSSVAYIDYSATITDFDVWIGLFRDSSHEEIPMKTEYEWETLSSATTLQYCLHDQANTKIYFNGTPDSAEALTLWYYPTIDPSAYTTASSTPWSGRLDDVIMEYVGMRAKNIDEMDITLEKQFLQDMENNIILSYAPNAAVITEGKGWL